MPAGTIAERVRTLIDEHHGGSVNAAATALRMPQPTLARIVAGAVNTPRLKSLEPIAKGYGASIDWLLTGEGTAPSGPGAESLRPWRAIETWRALLRTLRLPEHVERAWHQVPEGIAVAVGHFRVGYSTDEHHGPRMIGATRHSFRAWTDFLEEWIRIDGREAVRTAMSTPSAVNAARVGFSWYGIVLLQGTSRFAKDLALAIEKLAVDHGQGAENDPSGAGRRSASVPQRSPTRGKQAARKPRAK